MSSEPLLLAPNVFICMTQDHAVFLDLDRDAYSAVPAPSGPSDLERAKAALAAHQHDLLETKLLTDPGAPGRDVQLLQRTAARTHILGPTRDRRLFGSSRADGRYPFSYAWRTWRACGEARRQLRAWPIARTVKHIAMLKAARRPHTQLDMERAAEAFGAFRPWWPRNYLCLFDSLALALFLLEQGACPEWVFGVQLEPWGAHCWLEHDGQVLNECAEYAARFTPIMVV